MTLSDRLLKANSLLGPYAVPHEGTLGRVEPEPEDETRFPFQRDRDRIIHAHAFRRLQGKTQVFLAGEGDHYRTRLTHSMEVAQIGRDIARTLQLNEDLTEVIALAHDFGHPPFGHAGEEALDTFMQEHGSHFEHNQHSLRIVSVLEEHSPLHKGLNLNREVLEGLQKHEHLPHGATLEAQVSDLADEIAYTGHDTDDGLRAGLFTFEEIRTIPLANTAAEHARERRTSLRGALIHLLVTDLYAHSGAMLERHMLQSVADVYIQHQHMISFSEEMVEELRALRRFLWERVYLHPSVQQTNQDGQQILLLLCNRYFIDPPEKVLALQARTKSTLPEAVKDYVAGMTDTYAKGQAGER